MSELLSISRPPEFHTPTVLHVRTLRGNGPDKAVLRAARYTDPTQFRVAAVYIHRRNDPAIRAIREQAKAQHAPLYEIAEAGAFDPRTLLDLLQLCRRLRVTVWHAHDSHSNLLGKMVERFWPMKLVATVHGWTRSNLREKISFRIDNWCLRQYDHVIAVRPALARHCLSHGIARERLSYLPNAIDTQEFQRRHEGPDVRRELGVEAGAFVIGAVGRFTAEKGMERAVRTLAKLRQRYSNVQLHLVGDGPELKNLEALVGKLDLADAVRFWGWQPEPRRFYEMMDMLLVPSHREGSPGVVLEAMAMGVPVAATNVGAIGSLLRKGKLGVLLSQDQGTWATHIAPLVVSAERRQEIARQARACVETKYGFAQRVERESAVYGKVLSIRPVELRKAA